MFFLVAHTLLLMLQWWFFLKNWEIWPHEPSHGKSQESVKGWCWEMTPMISRGTCSTTFPGLRPLFLLDILDLGGILVGSPHLHMRPCIEITLSAGEPGVRSISLVVADVLELCIFILHPTLPRPPLHSSVTAHLLPVEN